MNVISKYGWRFSANARRKRAELFRGRFRIDKTTRILDLGSENGTNISNVLQGSDFDPANVYIADIDQTAVELGKTTYGFNPVLIQEDEPLPFDDGFFDIVYCSSVIEHTTVPKEIMWEITDQNDFAARSLLRQKEFAQEIVRLGKNYFVQTPSKTFPIESHTWLPLVGYLPRKYFLPLLRISNKYWVKKAFPDFNLLGDREMHMLFPDADIVKEKKWGMTKSIMAIKTD